MHRLALEWLEEGRNRSQVFSFDSVNRLVRIGRDAKECDVILKDSTKTVSGLHVEVYFNLQNNTFYLRNLTRSRDKPNSAWVDGKKIIQQEIPLKPGSTIQLGKMSLKVNIEPAAGSKPVYGLKCHVCGNVSPQADLSLVCRWCGTSLAAAETAVYFADESP